MSENKGDPEYHLLVLTQEEPIRKRLGRDLKVLCPKGFSIAYCSETEEALQELKDRWDQGGRVPIMIVDEDIRGLDGKVFIQNIDRECEGHPTCFIRLTRQPSLHQMDRLLETAAPSRTLAKPWLFEVLADCFRDMLHYSLTNFYPEDLPRFSKFAGWAETESGISGGEEGGIGEIETSFFTDRYLTDQQAFETLVREIDIACDKPERKIFERGTVVFQEGEEIHCVYILESGQVRLTRKAGNREILFHSHSAGRILGLLALAQKRRAFFTCHAVTGIRVIPLTLSQLDQAFIQNQQLPPHFFSVLVRSLATRNRRVAELQLEIESLNTLLKGEKDQLSKTLDLLAAAQGRIIESDRMATLGKLAAGVAHELNNPIAAIGRTANHLADDLVNLLGAQLDDPEAIDATRKGIDSTPLSSREERRIRKEFIERLGDESLARELIRVGLRDTSELDQFLEKHPAGEREKATAKIEAFYQVGSALRNLQHCGERVADLVRGLKEYARWDQGEVVRGDINQGIQDTLLIFSHELRRIRVDRRFGDIPQIECQMGRLNQVWTNLISNAIQAMVGEGILYLETRLMNQDTVEISITDSGHGIPPEQLDKLFDEPFTTKEGEKDFGLGIGLTLCREIVHAQQGTIRFESEPGRTTAIVTLPVQRKMREEDQNNGPTTHSGA